MRGSSLDKWKSCYDFGEVIESTFFPFKTPLDQSSRFQDEYVFTVSSLLDYLSNHGIPLGMVIDLTNTQRYYDPLQFEHENILHIKLPCSGYIYFPSEEQVETFIVSVKHFKACFPHKFVGVHCTHGANRTGFMIVSYLVKQLGMLVDDAIDLFEQHRPPGIYRQTVVEELKLRYSTPIPAPLLIDISGHDDRAQSEQTINLQPQPRNNVSHASQLIDLSFGGETVQHWDDCSKTCDAIHQDLIGEDDSFEEVPVGVLIDI